MTSEKELEKIRQLLQEVSDDDCNIFNDSSNSESDICEPAYRNSDTEPSDISDTEKLTSSDDEDDEQFMIEARTKKLRRENPSLLKMSEQEFKILLSICQVLNSLPNK